MKINSCTQTNHVHISTGKTCIEKGVCQFQIRLNVLRKQKLLTYSNTSCKSEEFLGALLKPVIRQLEGTWA